MVHLIIGWFLKSLIDCIADLHVSGLKIDYTKLKMFGLGVRNLQDMYSTTRGGN